MIHIVIEKIVQYLILVFSLVIPFIEFELHRLLQYMESSVIFLAMRNNLWSRSTESFLPSVNLYFHFFTVEQVCPDSQMGK